MAAMFGPAIGACVAYFLPTISVIWRKKELQDAVNSLEGECCTILNKIKDYRSSGEYCSKSGDTLNRHIAKLRQLANDMQDCIDLFTISKTMGTRAELFRKIPSLKETSKMLTDDYSKKLKYKSKESTSTPSSSTEAETKTSKAVEPWCACPVGMGEPIQELLELVKISGSQSERKQLKVITIVGFCGLGKTLLAEKVYRDKVVSEQFPLRVWVEATGKDEFYVIEEILRQVLKAAASSAPCDIMKGKDVQTNGEIRQNDELVPHSSPQIDIIKDRLSQCLKDRRYLVVIDDLQTTTLCGVPHFLESVGEVHSRIIVTTTNQDLAETCISVGGGGHLYKMSSLDQDNSKRLFFTVFYGDDSKVPNKGHSRSASPLVNKCDGLPLALVSTAEILRIKDDLTIKSCTAACSEFYHTEHEKAHSKVGKMHRALVSTYAGLSDPNLKDCLLYFCMFPPNHEVRTNSLIRRWLAEGIIKKEKHLNTLISRSIIQSMEISNGGDAKRCKAPGIMHEYIFRTAKSEEFMRMFSDTAGEDLDGSEYLRRLSIQATKTGIGKTKLTTDLSHLRTLAVFGTKEVEATEDLSNYLFVKSRSLTKYKVLRVLDLKECSGLNENHLEAICELLLLKYLSLGDSIVRIPRKIGSLKLLETLDLSRTKVVTVYKEVFQLPELKHLLGKFRLSKWDCIFGVRRIKKYLSGNCNLQTLSGFVTGKDEAFSQLMTHMQYLTKVKIWCDDTADSRNLTHLNRGIKAFVHKNRLEMEVPRSLSIDFSACINVKCAAHSLHFLNLQDHSNEEPQTEHGEQTKQGPGCDEAVNMQDNNQAAQTEAAAVERGEGEGEGEEGKGEGDRDGETEGGEGSEGGRGGDRGSLSNTEKNLRDNNKEAEIEEIEEESPRCDDASSRKELEIMQNHNHMTRREEERHSWLTALKLCGNLRKFPDQFVSQIAGIEELCLSSTRLSGKDILDALSKLPGLSSLKLCEDDLRGLKLQDEEFPSLRRLCFSVKHGYLPDPQILQHFCNIKEVHLYANLDHQARRSWKEAAKSHPERPMIWFGASKYEGTSAEVVTQNQ